MKTTIRACAALALLSSTVALAAEDVTKLQSKTATTHPIQYFISLPQGWKAGKTWPVVFVIEGASKEFQQNAEAFVRARGSMPFIIVAPLVITNGGPRYREVPTYHYSDETWAQIEKQGRCQWDVDGLAAIAQDVKKQYGGEDKYFFTGWEAGGHIVWAMAFQHPEALKAAAPVSPNYIGRCMEGKEISTDASRADMPIHVFLAEKDPPSATGILRQQAETAMKLAQDHGYKKVTETFVPGKERGPLPDEVLAYFFSLSKH